MIKIGLIVLTLLIFGGRGIKDDQDGHREPWADWARDNCNSDPRIIMDCDECNPHTNMGVTVWMCLTGKEIPDHTSFYTAHWYCVISNNPLIRYFYYLPFAGKDMK